ncbi:MAG TPA: adenine nucleotide alpha hydrolase family protein [Archaeoglobus profundus]|nr:adenine nucleotide alpha hydrolase family protein [Archaeoglobus profundus]
MKCKRCGRKAIANLRQYRIALCERCYPNFYLELVKRSIKKYKIIKKNEKILACVSGGKDSIAMAFTLKKLNYNIEILYIDLGIGEYSIKSKKVVEELAETIDVNLHVVKLKDFGFTIDDVNIKKVCSVCGTAKRYLMNRFARLNGFDVIATGHTVEDIILFFIKNVLSGSIEWIAKLIPRSESFNEKLITRARPLFERSEKENMLLVLAINLPFLADECPHAPQDIWKEIVYEIESKRPGFKSNFIRGLIKLASNIKIDKGWEVKYCKECGEVSNSELCAFCRYIKKFSKK